VCGRSVTSTNKAPASASPCGEKGAVRVGISRAGKLSDAILPISHLIVNKSRDL